MIRVLCLATLAVAPALGQPAQPRPVMLSVTPAPEPVPALSVQLMPDSATMVGGNGAVAMLRAITAIGPLTEEEALRVSELLVGPLGEFPLAEAAALDERAMAGAWPIMDSAARCSGWDWGDTFRTQGAGGLLPELGKLRQAGRLLALRARVHVARGEFDAAASTLRAGFALGYGLARAETLIQTLVGVAIAELMVQRVEEMVQQPGAPNLYWALARMPRADGARAFATERSLLDLHLPGLEAITGEPVDPESAAAMVRAIQPRLQKVSADYGLQEAGIGPMAAAALAAAQYPGARQAMLEEGYSPERIDALPVSYVSLRHSVRGFLRARDDLFKWVALPYWQGAAGLAEAEERADRSPEGTALQPFTAMLPAISRSYLTLAVHERHVAALCCIEAVRAHAASAGRLPESLAVLTPLPAPADPMTGAPFVYTPAPLSFTLSSPAPPHGEARHVLEYHVLLVK